MGMGKMMADTNSTIKFEDMYVPLGLTIKHPTVTDPSHAHPYHNEYIVFDETRIKIKFIILFDWIEKCP